MNGINESWETLDIKITGIGGPFLVNMKIVYGNVNIPSHFFLTAASEVNLLMGFYLLGRTMCLIFLRGGGRWNGIQVWTVSKSHLVT